MDFFKGFSCSNSPGVGCLFGTFKKALSSFSFCCHTFKMTHLLSEKPFFGAKLYFFSEGKQACACGIESYREKKYSRVYPADMFSPNILSFWSKRPESAQQ